MTPNQISVLIFGHDPRLLDSRKWVLQSCGYRALSARYLSAIDRMPMDPPVDLLVLCYTLSPRECENAIAHARLRWPDVKTLALVRQAASRYTGARPTTSHQPASVLTEVARALDAPDPLLSTVGEMVGHAASSACSHTY